MNESIDILGMAEQTSPVLPSEKKESKPYGKMLFYSSVLIIFTVLIVWMGVKINSLSQKLTEVEQLSKNNDHQLIYFNQILGKSLEPQNDNLATTTIEIRDSLEAFEKLTNLLSKVATLPIRPNDQVVPSQSIEEQKIKPKNTSSVNAEMRWWSQIGHFIFDPAKDFLLNLVKIQVLDSRVEQLAMTPSSQKQLKEELVMRLLTSRTLLLNGLVHQASLEVAEVKKIIEKNFAVQDKQTQFFLSELQMMTNDLEDLNKKTSQKNKLLGEKK
jgi:hypothetical protein